MSIHRFLSSAQQPTDFNWIELYTFDGPEGLRTYYCTALPFDIIAFTQDDNETIGEQLIDTTRLIQIRGNPSNLKILIPVNELVSRNGHLIRPLNEVRYHMQGTIHEALWLANRTGQLITSDETHSNYAINCVYDRASHEESVQIGWSSAIDQIKRKYPDLEIP